MSERTKPTATAEVDGFIICHPAYPAYAGYHTFGRTMTEAWERHIGGRERGVGEMATLRGRWAAKGYRPLPAKLVIDVASLPGKETQDI